MSQGAIDRRTILAGSTALAASALLPRHMSARTIASEPTTGQAGAALPARGEFVVRGAHVLTMDPALGDLPSGDVHVRDGAIVAVAASVPAPGAEVIDGRGMICMPGFVDTHWHLWTSALRPLMRQDDPQLGYFPVTVAARPAHTRRRTAIAACGSGLAEALSAGVTTTHNWAHNVRSPAHADAEIARHARHRHPRPLRLRHAAGRAERPADGPRRSRAREARAGRTTAC